MDSSPCALSKYSEDKIMTERPGIITMAGKPLTLVGEEIKVGMPAADCELMDKDQARVRLSSFFRKQVIIAVALPSLDTPVCEIEARRFSDEASLFYPQVQLLVISMDLPFAQRRWCGSAGLAKLKTLSDHLGAEFGLAYGILIKELRLLARSIFIINGQAKIQYVQLVKELTQEPDYNDAILALKKVLEVQA
jgi:thioredoxin-dependent peroxiredoxin